MNFTISDKVVCLGDYSKLEDRFKQFFPVLPEKGKVYVVRGVIDIGVENCPVKGLYLTGIISKNNIDGREASFASTDFELLSSYQKRKNSFDGDYDYWDNNGP